MKDFKNKLDNFISEEANGYHSSIHFDEDDIGLYFLDGAASLKPIVLKMYETMLKIRDNDLSRIDCRAFADMSIAELSQMLEGGSK